MKRPFAILFFTLALGICFFYKIKVSHKHLFIFINLIIISFLTCFIICKKLENISNLILLILIFTIGGFILQYKASISYLLTYKDKTVEIEGYVLDTIKVDSEYGKYLFKVESISYNDKLIKVNEKALLEIYGNKTLKVGDLINSKATVLQPKRNTNPGLFNYRLYLNTRGIYVQIRANSYYVNVLSKKNLSLYRKLTSTFANEVSNTFSQILNKKNAGIISGILLGDDTYIDSDIVKNFRELGLAHVLAVSGLHIGIIVYFFINLFRFVGINNKTAKVLATLMIWFYGLLIGYPVSVVRANIMFTLLILATLVHKRYDSLNILCFAGFIMLLYNPLWLFDVGFQLSLSAAASIILFNSRKFYTNNIKDKILSKLSPIIGVQLGTLPIVSYHFNKISIIALIANTLVIPLISISVVLGFLLIFFSYICIKISIVLGFILNIFLDIVNILSNIIVNFPITSMPLRSPSFIEVVLYYILLLLIYKHIKIDYFSWNIKKILFKYLLVNITFILLLNNFNHEISLEFIDVGQGDCSLMRFGSKAYLIDTGGSTFGDYDVGKNIVVPYLNKNGIKKLDGVFISHFHEDHCKGLLSIMDNIKIKRIIIGPRNEKNTLYTEIESKASELSIPLVIVSMGDNIYLSKDISIEILSPSEKLISTFSNEENNLSLVFLMQVFDKKILFTGDIEKEVEEILLKKNDNFRIDILKVPHHGSNTSSTISFIKTYNPKYAVIQVGNNNFGHPDDQVIRRYEDNHTLILRNDECGLITFKLYNNKLDMSYYLKKEYSIFNIIQKYTEELLIIITYILCSIYLSKLYQNIYNKDNQNLKYYTCFPID